MKEYGKEILLCIVLGMIIPYICFIIARFENNTNSEGAKIENNNIAKTELNDQHRISVLDEAGKVHTMSMDQYLTAVVLCEMPADFEVEALKAQAVVARTYALRRKSIGGKHADADICMDPNCCQGYCNPVDYSKAVGTAESLEKVKYAVMQTRDLVLVYEGNLIDATYFSCSGGMTEDAAAVWGSEIPYLQSVKSPGEEGTTYYTNTVTFTTAEFAEKIRIDLKGNPESWIEEISYTSGGGVDCIRICGKEFKGTDFRKLLGLRSTAFVITVVGNTVTITTKGYGHRVGMSQYGADAMAAQGKRYDEILSYYYRGTRLVSMDSLPD